ncbi:MAG: PIN domain-containing protein [Actinomycetota bacterium]|nr:PIN domain-containing protein [Actinomycetota bacterium]
MTRVLADTSVWVTHLRGNSRATSRLLAGNADGSLTMTEPVAMELLAGARPGQVAALDQLVNAIPSLGILPDLDFRAAAAIKRAVRADGHTVRSLVDCLIAAVVLRHGDVVLVHDDIDFERIASVTDLRQERWPA